MLHNLKEEVFLQDKCCQIDIVYDEILIHVIYPATANKVQESGNAWGLSQSRENLEIFIFQEWLLDNVALFYLHSICASSSESLVEGQAIAFLC